MKRLFIAINLPDSVKKTIERIVDDFKIGLAPEIRWLPPENWHLTVSFLGYQPDETIGPILESLKETANNFEAPEIEFEKIAFGPPNRPPRMIWLIGAKETSQNLAKIKNYLDDALIKNGVRFKMDSRRFSNAHVTLARFKPNFRRSDYENISIKALGFQAQSLDLMEAFLKCTGAEYTLLQSMDFRNQ